MVFDLVYFGLIGSCSFIGIGLLMAADVRLDFLLRGGRTGMSDVVKETDDNFAPDDDDDDEGWLRFECKLDALLFCLFGASSPFGGSMSGVALASGSASANFPTTGSKLSEIPSDVR